MTHNTTDTTPARNIRHHVFIGLGNPGPQYARTRHNVGFMTLDIIASRLGRPERKKTSDAFNRFDFTQGLSTITLLYPMMYMNLSGEAMCRTGINWKSPTMLPVVIYDDVSLPLGRIRIRTSGSAGGHNGIRNIIERLGTQEIARIRLGVGGSPQGRDLRDHVLGGFHPDDRKPLDDMLARAAEAANHIVDHGLENAMNTFNASPAPTPKNDSD